MRKIFVSTALMLVFASVFTSTIFAAEAAAETRRERETDSSFVETEFFETLEEDGWIENWPGVLPDLETESCPSESDEKNIYHWSVQGVDIDPSEYPVTVDVRKKVLHVLQENNSESSEIDATKKIWSVDTTGKIISDSEVVLNMNTAEKIAGIYRDLIADCSDINIWIYSEYVEEDSVWLISYMSDPELDRAKLEIPDGYKVYGGGRGMTIALRTDGTVARIYHS